MPTGDFTLKAATPDDHAPVSALLDISYSTLLRPHYADGLLAAALPVITGANTRLLASGTYYVAKAAEGSLIGCGAPGGDRHPADRQNRLSGDPHAAVPGLTTRRARPDLPA